MARLPLVFLLLICLSGCVRRDLMNSSCYLPAEPATTLNLTKLAQQHHLTADAQLAEDLAIRYADVHKGLHSGRYQGLDQYVQAREQCMANLFQQIASTHGVSQQQVRFYLTQRRMDFDLPVVLSFAVFYGFASAFVARRLCRRFPAEDGRMLSVLAIVATSAAVSLAGVLLGEVWSDCMEGLRVGNSHMSYRASRIPWTNHHLGLFIGGVLIFWIVAAIQYRTATHRPETQRATGGLTLTGAPHF